MTMIIFAQSFRVVVFSFQMSQESCCVVVTVDIVRSFVVVIIVGSRNITLKFSQNSVSNS